MLLFALVQVVFAVSAVRVGARVAMGFGRDLRANLFHQVTDFSAREVGAFGAPSLITRITNDVQQVQMLVVMACTMAIAAPITIVVGVIFALRQDVGLSVVLVFAMPFAAIVLGLIVSQMVPAFRLMQDKIDQINRVLREQITGIRVVRAFVREPEETGRASPRPTPTSPPPPLRGGRLDVVDVPRRQPAHQRVERGGALDRRQPGGHRRPAGRLAHRLPQLPGADPDVGGDGHLHHLDGPSGRRVRRPDPGGARHRLLRGASRPIR